ncbi:MAG: hypothetical protein ACREOF_02775, partial [Gemmatimonadales bacterium]
GSDVGPYFVGSEWDDVRVVEARSARGDPVDRYGSPFELSHPVLMRVLNRVYMALDTDRLWVLHQGFATVIGYTRERRAVDTIRLPVHHRGIEPIIEVGDGLRGGYRRNRAHYYPNVAGLALAYDSLLATIRYHNYQQLTRVSRDGRDWTDFWPESEVEVFDRRGRVVCSSPVPGRAHLIAGSDRAMAVIAELDDGDRTVLIAPLPHARECGST